VSDFTKLELAVLDAIADETTEQAPELPGQIADARVVDRARTASGFITHIQVDPARTAPIESAPGQLGTIHADIAGLADPVGFRAVIAHGRLTALETETYGQDTAGIDFATAPFGGLFRITPEGESVPAGPSLSFVPESPVRRLQRADDAERTAFGAPGGFTYFQRGGFARFLRDWLAASAAGRRVLDAISTPIPRPLATLLRIPVYVPLALGVLLLFSLSRPMPVTSDIVARLGPDGALRLVFPLFLTSALFTLLLDLRRLAMIRRKVLTG
jgi:hypothetical protein